MSSDCRLLIDTDIGTDDAVALLLAFRTPGVAVEAITTVAGNTDVDSCVRNARFVSELCRVDVPIYRGSAAPFIDRRRARHPVHGDLGGLGLRPNRLDADDGFAPDRLIDFARRYPRQLTLVTLGPLTNLARALISAPDLAENLEAVIVMGGASSGRGTATPRAEFNFWIDPEAARFVLGSRLKITLVDIEPSRGPCAIDAADQARLKRLRTKPAELAAAMCAASAMTRPAAQAGLPDAIAMAVALAPEIVTGSERCHVDVDVSETEAAGEMRVDRQRTADNPPNVTLVTSVDAKAYKAMLFAACR